MTTQMTTKQYAEVRGICDGAVRKAIKLGHSLPGVVTREMFGNAHLLKVANSFISEQKRTRKKIRKVTK